MELKKLQEQWDSFPEMSMEERPVLSSDLEKIVVKNPLSDAFYVKNKILLRIAAAGLLLIPAIYQLRKQVLTGGNNLDCQISLLLVLTYFIYFHIRLLFYADYPTLLSLKLTPFLTKIETILDKYIFSFGIMAILAAFYTLALAGKTLSFFHLQAGTTIDNSSFYKWLIVIFLSVSYHILFMHAFIPRYKKLLVAVRKYKDGITGRPNKKK